MNNVLTLLGLIYRSGKMMFGENVLDNMEKIKYIVIANDISEKSRERCLKKCHYYNVDYLDCFTSAELTRALGKRNVKLIGITDKGFVNSLINKMKEVENG